MKLYSSQRILFPDPTQAIEDDLVAMGDEMTVPILLEAYSFGIFPWPHDEMPVLWFCPQQRGVLDFKDLHIPKSLLKFKRKSDYKLTFNQCFDQVIESCVEVKRPEQSGTWITSLVVQAYKRFHKKGYVHSVECWQGDQLIGGLYGVFVAGVFSAESMFYKKDNASKLCLIGLIECLKKNGLNWLDIQMVTPNLEQFGGKYIARDQFLLRLEKAKETAKKLNF